MSLKTKLLGDEKSPTFLGTVLGFNGQASKDFWTGLPSATSETAVEFTAPVAKSVSKPLTAGAIIAVVALIFYLKKK